MSRRIDSQKFVFATRKKGGVTFDFDAELERFLYAKRLAKRSPDTIEIYEQTMKQFRRWYTDCGETIITADLMRRYVAYLTEEKTRWDDHPTSPKKDVGLSPRSVNNIIRNMRVFFNYLVGERVISFNPVNAVNYQTDKKDTFEVFTDDEVKRLLAAPNRKVYTGLRDACMMLVMIDCALRIKELTSLKVSDVDFKLRQITVRAETSKTGTTRVCPFSRETAAELTKLLDMMNAEDDDYLWLTQFGERYYGDTFAKLLKNYATRAGISGPRVSPHTFRHYSAVSMIRAGSDPFTVMRILGHTTLTMTEKYIRFTGGDIREQHEKASPVTRIVADGNEKKRGKRRF